MTFKNKRYLGVIVSILIVTNLILVGIYLTRTHKLQQETFSKTSQPQRVNTAQKLESCGTEFAVSNNDEIKFIKCGLYSKDDITNHYLGKLKDIRITDNEIQADIEMYTVDSDNDTTILTFLIGEIDSNYTWITTQNEFTLYHTESNFNTELVPVTQELAKKILFFKDSYILISVLNSDETLKVDIDAVENQYKNDVILRKEYISNCLERIQSANMLKKDNGMCESLAIQSITVFDITKN